MEEIEVLQAEIKKLREKNAGLIIQLDSVSAELVKEKGFEAKTEKKIGFWVRNILRLMGWIALSFYLVFRICIPLIGKEPLRLDSNDGWVIGGSIVLLLAVDAAKSAIGDWVKKKLT